MEQITNLPLGNLHESPTNPRKSFASAGLQELADSIRSQGVMSPIVVRPHPTHLHPLHYEIVFGHRRFRAAKLAELDGIPAIIRQLTDEQAGLAQLHENLEREDVSPIEEAEAYQRLMTWHAVTAEALMAQTGKSKSYIYGRLKLTKLCIEVRQACSAGLPTDVALKIARIPLPIMQVKALAKMRNADDSWLSVRQGLQVLDGLRHTIPLISADFDSSIGPCVACQYRSDNDPDLLIALGAGVCTYSSCFDDMTTEYHAARIEAHAAAGLPTLIGEAAQIALNRSRWPITADPHRSHVDICVFVDFATLDIADILKCMCTAAPEITLALDGRGKCIELLEMRHLAALREFCGIVTAPVAASISGLVGNQTDDEDDDEGYTQKPNSPALIALPPTDEELAVDDNWPIVLLAVMRAAAAAPRTVYDLRQIIGVWLENIEVVPLNVALLMGWSESWPAHSRQYGDDTDWVQSQLADMPADDLSKLLLLLSLSDGPVYAKWSDRLPARVAIAKQYGIDPLNVAPSIEPAAAAEPGRVIRRSNPLPNHELDLNAEPAEQAAEVQP